MGNNTLNVLHPYEKDNDFSKVSSTELFTRLSRENVLNFDLDKKIDSMMSNIDGFWVCNICDKKRTNRIHIKNHVEGVHISGISHPCPICRTKLNSRSSLQAHGRKFHKNDFFHGKFKMTSC